jgi:alkyl hydroperoxide reductase subunit AhpC
MGTTVHKLTLTLCLLALQAVFSFAAPTGRLPLTKELQGNQVPRFFVLAPDNVGGLNRDDINEDAKKSGTKRIVLSFFATHCVSCRQEFKILKENADELKKRKVQVYLINVGQGIHEFGDKVKALVEEHAGKSFPYYFDPNANIHKIFGMLKADGELGLPLTIILDSDMRALGILYGEMGDDFPQILWGNF